MLYRRRCGALSLPTAFIYYHHLLLVSTVFLKYFSLFFLFFLPSVPYRQVLRNFCRSPKRAGSPLPRSLLFLSVVRFLSPLYIDETPSLCYNYINQSDTLKDIFLYYRDENTANTYGGFKSNQNAFNKALDDLNLIDINEIDTE